MAPGPHCIGTAHDLAARRPLAGRRLRDLRRQRRADTLLFGLPRGVPRGIPVEPRGDVAGLLDLRARQRRERAVRWRAGGPPRASAPRAARRDRSHPGTSGQRLRARALADRRALRRPHDARSQRPRARGVRARPLAPLVISAIGWRHAYFAQAALMGALVWPLAALFRRDEPPLPAAAASASPPGAGAAAARAA